MDPRLRPAASLSTGPLAGALRRDPRRRRRAASGRNGRRGPVGAGAGCDRRRGDYLYALNEFPDVSLACRAGQNWDLGSSGARTATSTRWEPLPAGNPIVRSSRAPEAERRSTGCNVLYPTLFRDPATAPGTSCTVARARIPPTAGSTSTGSSRNTNELATGTSGPATRRAGQASGQRRRTLAAPRTPNATTDGTSYLASSCGGGCAPGQSVFQDVRLPAQAATSSVRGEFRSEAGSGSLDMVVHQIGADGTCWEPTRWRRRHRHVRPGQGTGAIGDRRPDAAVRAIRQNARNLRRRQPLPQTVEDSAPVSATVRATPSRRLASSERWSASSTRTTRRPAAPSEIGGVPSRTHATKCSHSVRSGSTFESRGLQMSPERVMYSPYEFGRARRSPCRRR